MEQPSSADVSSRLRSVWFHDNTRSERRLGRISKRGKAYLRRMFIHGARAWLLRAKSDSGTFENWVRQLQARTARNKVVVAVANKLARVAWAVLFTSSSHQR
jgi:transposase